jgi:hypothetical protein
METKTIVVEVESNLGSLKSQLREAQAEVSAMSEKFGATSVEAMNAAKAAARLKDTIGDAKVLTDAFNPDAKFKALTASMSGALNGFQAVQGAMGLFGAEGKEVEEMMLKVQSAMALTQGIDGVLESIDSFKTLGVMLGIVKKAKVVDTAITATQATVTATATAATGGMTLAQKALNLVMKANPVFLIIGGITALIGAFMLFSGSSDKAAESQRKLNEQMADTKAFMKIFSDIADGHRHELELMKIRGASDKELFQQKLTLLSSERTSRNIQATEEANNTRQLIITRKYQLKRGEDDLAESTKAEIKTSQDKWKALKLANSTYYQQVQIETETFNANEKQKEEDKIKEANDKAKAANDKYKADKKTALDSIKALEKEYNDSLLSDHDLEVLKVNEKYAKEIALAKKYKQDTETLEAARKTALNDIELRTEEARLKIIEDAEIAAAKIKADALIEFNKTIKDIAYQNELNLLSEQEREIQLVKDKYTALEEAAKGNAEAMAVINEAKGAETKVINDKYAKEDKDREDSVKNAKIQMTSDAIGVIGELASSFAGKSEASQKRAFNINKAASIAQATISTYQAAQSAYASQLIPGDPSSLIRGAVAAGISVASGIAKVAMIAKTQFNSNGGGGGGGGDKLDSLPAATAAATPANFNLVGNSGTNQLLQGLQNQPLQAFVVGGDVTSQQSLDRNRITTASI